jgi:uncharacterized FAD-dependent dehydrogenase
MITIVEFACSPEEAKDEVCLQNLIRTHSGKTFPYFRWKKRSIDARSRNIKINATFECADEPLPSLVPSYDFKNVSDAPEIHIIGAGPAGLFAALRALELGYKPIVFERGKDVRARRRDLARISREQQVDEESNYGYGEGGAGTYSDGKLYTRSKKRGDVDKVLRMLVYFGANEDILVDAHPHIGTNKLPNIISKIRETIQAFGGEIHFSSKLTQLKRNGNSIQSIQINNDYWLDINTLILATGHSARDVFHLLHNNHIKILAKPFALGVRIEHAQTLIDQLQYHGRTNDAYLPPASYSLVTQVEGKGVYSFCMCPGGIIAPCATANGEVVTNGWSPSKRNNPYSNSGIVVSIEPGDFKNPKDPFVCLNFQQEIERSCYEATGDNQKVPAQRMKDFVEGKLSADFPRTSYTPGIVSVRLDNLLPAFISKRLQKAFLDFEKKMPGYYTNDAVIHAPESRTSSPILVPRDREKLHHVDITNLYPCAEGAGYAGGIVSAAIDGMNCVEAMDVSHDE